MDTKSTFLSEKSKLIIIFLLYSQMQIRIQWISSKRRTQISSYPKWKSSTMAATLQNLISMILLQGGLIQN